jgi:hypothetical protein
MQYPLFFLADRLLEWNLGASQNLKMPSMLEKKFSDFWRMTKGMNGSEI